MKVKYKFCRIQSIMRVKNSPRVPPDFFVNFKGPPVSSVMQTTGSLISGFLTAIVKGRLRGSAPRRGEANAMMK
jgi:hypothetical protein